MRQFSFTDNNTGKTSDESHIVSFKQNSMMQALPFVLFYFFYPQPKCVSIQFCCNPSNGYGIMRADGFIFLAYDCHIKDHYRDLNTSVYAKAIFTAGLSNLAALH